MSEARSLRGFRKSIDGTPRRRLRSAGGPGAGNGDSSVPGYAQPTISSSYRMTNDNTGKILTLKAGASKSRPTTKSNIRTSSKPPTAVSQNRAGQTLTGLFQNGNSNQGTPKSKSSVTSLNKNRSSFSSPTKNSDNPYLNKENDYDDNSDIQYGTLNLKKNVKTGSYRSPSLARKVQSEKLDGSFFDINSKVANDDDEEFTKLIQETENLIFDHDNPKTELSRVFDKYELLGITNGREYIPVNEWESLVEYHSIVIDNYQKKLSKDSQLVFKILELNRRAALESDKYKKQLKTAEQEIEILRSTLNLVYKENLKYEQQESINVKSINNDDITPLSGNLFNYMNLELNKEQEYKSLFNSPSVLNSLANDVSNNVKSSTLNDGHNINKNSDDLNETDADVNDLSSNTSEVLPPVPNEYVSNSALNRVQNYFSSIMSPSPLPSSVSPSNPTSSKIYDDIYQVLARPQ
ncbi:hypothetical protein BN7_810 [Wickerhamomyces ciferrii]|uniref:Uncharacterized protein n=1 Tax=Wickerhamomyces ciferrii (strain ATCC 14091 / BCRC 22168 / CBS 111 / JCM 3599 / NBRC 0793 / NRRL Y-1031 F-60-10) TaxID=1206466 RepID=K0KJL8_WICCF|nr:uncharacterized protein BN7_810 [Wickerhamomyces ciferrii]CCH41273.1 hypothetical protein BN7_810 [Wickerhamomyces ciferrii]